MAFWEPCSLFKLDNVPMSNAHPLNQDGRPSLDLLVIVGKDEMLISFFFVWSEKRALNIFAIKTYRDQIASLDVKSV